MGCTTSKPEKDEPLRLCKERRRFIKQAIDSRYALAAAHVSYVQSLRNVGVALRRFAEAEVLIESSLSATELDKTPSPPSSSSHSPSHIAEIEVSDSPLRNGSPVSLPVSTMSYMRSSGSAAVTVKVNPPSTSFVDEESLDFTKPPRSPPLHESCSSWDFFDPIEDLENFQCEERNERNVKGDDLNVWGHFKHGEGFGRERYDALNQELARLNSLQKPANASGKSADAASINSEGFRSNCVAPDHDPKHLENISIYKGAVTTLIGRAALEQPSSNGEKDVEGKDLSAEREDPSEFITHRAKDFLSSIKDIEHRFFKASESGKDASRLLEANKIRVGYTDVKGGSLALNSLAGIRLACCGEKTALVSHEPPQHATKVITWNRTTSSQSCSSKNPLATASKDDISESGSDFVEEFCMFAGSHSSSLDRLYAWERKLYDEVKASQCIRKEYDRKCYQLRHQYAKDLSSDAIDKTRSVAKDLHSRIRVAIHSVDGISRRIEKMRDDELLPQLLEFIQGLIKMWKDMLECHHAQYITISLSYHARSSMGNPPGDKQRLILIQLREEIECFGLSFADWINSQTSYVDALNCWLQNCILQPQGRSKSRRPFSPRRALAPVIFVLCRDWLAGLRALPSDELSEAIKSFTSDLNSLIGRLAEEEKKQKSSEVQNAESDSKSGEANNGDSSLVSSIRSGLTKVLDRLTKFSEASLRTYEDIKKKNETAQKAYTNCRPVT